MFFATYRPMYAALLSTFDGSVPLNAPLPGGRTLRDIAGQVLEIARGGLKARARMDDAGRDETGYLAPLDDIAASGITHAERLLARYHGEWAGDLGRVYADESY